MKILKNPIILKSNLLIQGHNLIFSKFKKIQIKKMIMSFNISYQTRCLKKEDFVLI